MTGRHPIRSGTTKVVWGMLYGMTQWERTLPELAPEQGYTTGMYGKWHLGDTPGRFPTDQGFDEWYGIANTTDEALYSSHYGYDPEVSVQPYVVEARKGEVPRQVKPYDLDARRLIDSELTEKAIDFMARSVKDEKPFFAFVPFTHAHLPTFAHPDFAGKTGNGQYADVLSEIDYRTGEILDAIDELGIRENTVVLWLSDNGPEEIEGFHGTAGYWRGNYFTALEGSLRVPALIRWPGKIPSGTVSNEIVHIVDVLPTLARIAGAKVPDGSHHRRCGPTGVLSRQTGELQSRGLSGIQRRRALSPTSGGTGRCTSFNSTACSDHPPSSTCPTCTISSRTRRSSIRWTRSTSPPVGSSRWS